MNHEEAIGLLAMINQYDTRINPTDRIADAWAAALEDTMPLSYAAQQVVKYYSQDRPSMVSIGWLNAQWREERRREHSFVALPEPQGTRIEKERARWWMMQGIIEGLEELNTGVAKDPWVAGILRLRMKHGVNLQIQDYKKVFRHLDWEWFEELAPVYGKRLGY